MTTKCHFVIFIVGDGMTKVVLNGEIIELSDELEKGKAELDLLQERVEKKDKELG